MTTVQEGWLLCRERDTVIDEKLCETVEVCDFNEAFVMAVDGSERIVVTPVYNMHVALEALKETR